MLRVWLHTVRKKLIQLVGVKPSKSEHYNHEGVYVVDSLHQQFLKEELLDRYSRGISQEKRTLYARLIGVTNSLSNKDISLEQVLSELSKEGLEVLVSETLESNGDSTYLRIVSELSGLIDYWEEPHLRQSALPIFKKALAKKLGIEECLKPGHSN